MPKTENVKRMMEKRRAAKGAAEAPAAPPVEQQPPVAAAPPPAPPPEKRDVTDEDLIAHVVANPGTKPADLVRKFKVGLNRAKAAIAAAPAPGAPAEAPAAAPAPEPAKAPAAMERALEESAGTPITEVTAAVVDAITKTEDRAAPAGEPVRIPEGMNPVFASGDPDFLKGEVGDRRFTVVEGGAGEIPAGAPSPERTAAIYAEAAKLVAAAEADAATAIADDAARAARPAPGPAAGDALLAIASIREHPANPRLLYPRLEELAADIGEHGLRDPIKVRPVEGGYEVVSGHRRLRAAQRLGWAEIPARVKEMDDLAAYKEVVAENEHREDLTAIEEGLAFQGLLQRGQTVEQVATFIGKSVAHVYARMKLVALCEAGRQAMLAGWLTPETALLVARIPTPALQERALTEIGPDEKQGHDAMSYREAQQHVQTHYMLVLAKAPFDRKAEDLVAGAGACSACPKRSGALPAELRADLKGADICLDRDCYGQKTQATWDLQAAAAKERGAEVVDAKEAERRYLVHHGDEISTHGGLCDLDAVCYEDKEQRTFRQLLGKKNAPAADVVIQSPHTGAAVEGWKREKLVEAAVAAKAIRPPKEDPGPTHDEKEAAARKKIREHRKVGAAAIAAVMAKPPGTARWPVEVWRAAADQVLEFQWGNAIGKRRGLGDEKDNPYHALGKAIAKMSAAECQDLILEAVLQKSVEYSYHPNMGTNDREFRGMLDGLGVDLKAVAAQVKAGPAPADDEEEAPEKKKAGAKGPLARKLKGKK